ncbi:hypothetical protein C500_16482 [Natrialba magadii ATCC 43099]|uniref:Uncharacterized protein n=1 Tax=Natrialba magadii (strain ATCC 43099 / DSM 3394 / CCM 3739 / CIP 104546 / IAM 13178 / JCM 8861 / NBRC 102185 / NCIMB 2190 / MS3) TaxID=547559 RepID=L9UMV7_NATMM|nr:hypothetical protein C500_16482 [Natrialba magadii ATCC 43099]
MVDLEELDDVVRIAVVVRHGSFLVIEDRESTPPRGQAWICQYRYEVPVKPSRSSATYRGCCGLERPILR